MDSPNLHTDHALISSALSLAYASANGAIEHKRKEWNKQHSITMHLVRHAEPPLLHDMLSSASGLEFRLRFRVPMDEPCASAMVLTVFATDWGPLLHFCNGICGNFRPRAYKPRACGLGEGGATFKLFI